MSGRRRREGGLGCQNVIQIAALPRAREGRPGLMVIGLAGPPERRALDHPVLIDPVLTEQGHLLALGIVAVEARLPGIEFGVEIGAVLEREERAFDRDELGRGIAVCVLDKTDQRELRIGRHLPGQRRHEDLGLLIDLIDLRARIAVEADKPEGEGAVFPANRAGHIAGHLIAVEIADLGAQLTAERVTRRLRHIVDDPARRPLPVKHRGRAFQNLDLLDRIEVGAGRIVAAEQLLDGVAIARQFEAPRLGKVAACGKAIGLGRHA